MVSGLLDALPVKRKLLLLTLMTSAVALFVSATLYTLYQLQSLREESERHLMLLAEVVAEQSRLALRHGDSSDLQRTLDALARDDLIEAAVVAGGDGRAVATFHRDGTRVPRLADAAAASEAGALVSFRRVLVDGEPIGGVYLRGDSNGLYTRLTREGLVGGAVMLLSFLAALLLSGRVRRTISEPIEHMTAVAREGHLNWRPLPTDAGSPDELRMLSSALRDLGDRLGEHEKEQERRRKLETQRLEATANALVELEPDGTMNEVNHRLREMLDLGAEAIAGRSWVRLLNPADAARAEALRGRVADTGATESAEVRLRDGSGRWVAVRVTLQVPDTRAPAGSRRLLMTVEDRRENELLQDGLREIRQRLGGLLACSQEALLELDAEARIVSASETAARLFVRPRDTLVGADWTEFAGDFDLGELHRHLDALAAGQTHTERALLRRNGGEMFPARVTWLRLDSADDGLLMATVRDLGAAEAAARDLQAARDAAQEAALARDTLVRNISHEVRNPVTAIIAASELLDREMTGAGRERCMEMMRNSADALLDVVDSLIDFSQLRAGTFAPDCISFEPRPIFETVLDVHAARASTKGIDLGLYVDDGVPFRLRGDPRRLRQVLLQLVGGAVRLTERGAVTVRVGLAEARADGRVRLDVHVRGHGPGVARELRVCLTPGADGVDDQGVRGGLSWSLGLTLAQTLSAMMEGDLSVSELAGGQFEVCLRLPLDPVAGEQPAVAGGPSIARQRLLLLYTDNDVAETLTANLADLGTEVVRADGPREALHLLRGAHADGDDFPLAMVDSALPGKEARNLLQAIRGDARLARTRLVLVQHLSGDDSAQANADTVLVAPVRPSRLAASLRGGPSTDHIGHAPQPTGMDSDVARARVLVADDDSGVQAALCFMLESLGYAVDAVANGSEVLVALSRHHYDVVVLDCRMPVMDGFDTAAAIVGRRALTPVPIIAISGCLTPDDEERLREAGVSAWLSKPIKEKSLLDAIERCVPSKQMH